MYNVSIAIATIQSSNNPTEVHSSVTRAEKLLGGYKYDERKIQRTWRQTLMIGSIHFEVTEKGISAQTHLCDVSDFDKFRILCLLQCSLEISKKEFEFANLLIQSGLDKLLVPEQNTTEVSILSEVLEMLNKMKGDNNDEG